MRSGSPGSRFLWSRSLPPPRINVEHIIVGTGRERWHPSFFEKNDGPRFLPGQIPHEVPTSPARPPGRLLAAGAQLLVNGVDVIRHASVAAATGRSASQAVGDRARVVGVDGGCWGAWIRGYKRERLFSPTFVGVFSFFYPSAISPTLQSALGEPLFPRPCRFASGLGLPNCFKNQRRRLAALFPRKSSTDLSGPFMTTE